MSRLIKISDFEKDSKNFNKHTEYGMALLQKSIEQVGVIESITVSADDKVITGNARQEKMIEVFGAEIDAMIIETDGKKPIILKRTDIQSGTKEFHEAALLANTTAKQNILFDFDLIQEIAVDEFDIDIIELGVDIVEFDKNIEVEDDNFVPPKEVKTDIVVGDLFEIQHNGTVHRLMCGDSTKIEDVSTLMNGSNADMIFTDPPYNLNADDIGSIASDENFVMGGGEMTDEQFIEFLKKIFNNLYDFSVEGSIHYICMDWRHALHLLIAGKRYDKYKALCVWKKHAASLSAFYQNQHELIFVFQKGKGKYTRNFSLKDYRTNVWEYEGQSHTNWEKLQGAERVHPTMKPLRLVADAILDCSLNNNIILDLFGGSGTTLIASAKTNRKCYMMELDPKYCQVIIDRFKNSFPDAEIIKQSNNLNVK